MEVCGIVVESAMPCDSVHLGQRVQVLSLVDIRYRYGDCAPKQRVGNSVIEK